MNGFIAEEEPLPDDFAEHVIELTRRVQAESARLDEMELAEREEQQRAEEERARRARAGEHGSDWRTVQQRIDLHQTTLEDVFSGADETSAAEALRRTARSNFARMRELWEEQEDPEEEPTPLDLIGHARADSAVRFREAAARIRDAVDDVERRRDGGETR